jgi:hypothetical protein
MSSSDITSDKHLVLLSHDNYDTWSRRMLYQLEKDNVWWTISRMPAEPATLDDLASFVVGTNNPTLAKYKMKWELDSRKAINGIMANCDAIRYEEVNTMVEEEGLSASGIWIQLKAKYKEVDGATNAQLWSDLVKLSYDDSFTHENVQKTMDAFVIIANKIKSTHLTLSDIITVFGLRLNAKFFPTTVDFLALQENVTLEKAFKACIVASKRKKDSAQQRP